MRGLNPAVIPHNLQIDQAITKATEKEPGYG
mgnify:CR=1 FL=1